MLGTPSASLRRRRFGLSDIILLIVGSALGAWGFTNLTEDESLSGIARLYALTCFPVGIALVGVPWFALDRRYPGRWRGGRLLWFTLGLASWVLAGPRLMSWIVGNDTSYMLWYFYYTTPVSILALLLGLICTGWLRSPIPRADWRDRAGLGIGFIGAAYGIWLVILFNVEPFEG